MTVTHSVPAAAVDASVVAEQFIPLESDGLFWRLAGDWRGGLLAARALLLQVAHPVVGAGVGEHSVYKTDPYGRLDRTTKSTLRLVYGGADGHAEGERLRRLHREIKGVDEHGRRYSALNPEAYLWVHATGFELGVVFHELFGTPLSPEAQERLFQEWRTVGWRLGIPSRHLPKTQAEFWEFWHGVVPKLENNRVVQDLLWESPPPPPKVPGFIFRAINDSVGRTSRGLAAWTLPEELRERIGLPRVTAREEQKLRRVCARMRFLGDRLPERMLVTPLARKAQDAAVNRQELQAS
jgi:uncharacterized protein (DUF2236 family)